MQNNYVRVTASGSTMLTRLEKAFSRSDDRPTDLRRFARYIDLRCSTDIDLGTFATMHDQLIKRRRLFDAVAAVKRRLAPLMYASQDETYVAYGPVYVVEHEYAAIADQLVDPAVTDPDRRREAAEKLLCAIETIMNLRIRKSFAGEHGPRTSEDATWGVAIAAADYMRAQDNEKLAWREVRSDREQVRLNKRVVMVVQTTFRALGIKPRLKVETMLKRIFAREQAA